MQKRRGKSKFRIAKHTPLLVVRRWLVRNSRRVTMAFFVLAFVAFSAFYNFPELRGESPATVKIGGDAISFQTVKDDLAAGLIERGSLVRNSNEEWKTLVVTYKDGRVEWLSIKANPELTEAAQSKITATFSRNDIPLSTSVSSGDKSNFDKFTSFGMTIVIMTAIAMIIMVMGGQVAEISSTVMGMTGSRKKSTVRFSDVAGIEGAKADLEEIVQFIRHPSKFEAIGARPNRGVLLAGPPGTGKTLLAKAVAGESNAAFLAFTPNDFSSMYIGIGKQKVRNAFARAREQAPAILFIDEIDTLTRKRGQDHREYDAILNEILVLMDGFEARDGVIVIGATNRVDTMDPAILRPGRFDRIVQVPLPDASGRGEILKVHTSDLPVEADVDLSAIARRATGYSGAELENLANEAALTAARRGAERICKSDFEAALNKLTLGARRTSLVLSETEKHIVAVHEAGHAICSVLLPGCGPIDRVTILPHEKSLGAVVRQVEGDSFLLPQSRLEDQLVIIMAGRAAETVIFGEGEFSNGASGDNKEATDLAMRMVCEWGMSPDFGPLFIQTNAGDQRVQRAARTIIEKALKRAHSMLSENRAILEALAAELLKQETMSREQVERMVHSKPKLLANAA